MDGSIGGSKHEAGAIWHLSCSIEALSYEQSLEDLQAGRDPFAPAPAPETESDPETYYRSAKWCFRLPFLSMLISWWAYSSIKDSTGAGHTLGALVLTGANACLLVGSLTLGVIALCGISRHGASRILMRSIFGIVISVGLLSLIAGGFVHGFREGMMRAQARQLIHDASGEMRVNMKREMDEKGGVTMERQQLGVQKMEAALDTLSQNTTGDTALLAKASKSFLAKAHATANEYAAATKALKEPAILDMTGVTSRDQLESKKKLVQRFMAANDKLTGFATNSHGLYQKELESFSVPAADIKMAMKSGSQTAQQIELGARIRDDDRRAGTAMLSMLDLLENNLGKWKYNSERKKVEFDQATLLDKYVGYREEMDDALQEQGRLQVKLVNLNMATAPAQ